MSASRPVSAWTRDDAALYLQAALADAQDIDLGVGEFLVSPDSVRMAYEWASRTHQGCGCEHARRLRLARDLLLDETSGLHTDIVATAQGRLL